MNSQPLQNERLFLFTLAGMMFTHILDFMIMIPLGPQLMRLLQVSTHDFGLLLSCYTFAAAASSFLAANFIDRFDHRKTFLTLYFLFSLATLACALAQSFAWLLLARTLAGMFGGLIEAMVHTMLAANIPFARRGVATGKIYAAFSLSTVIGVPSGLYLANLFPQLNWHAPFLLLSGICGLFFLLALSQLPRTSNQLQQQRVNHFLLVLQNPQLRLALLFVALATCGGFLVMPYVPLYLTSNVNVAESFIPTIYLCAGVATLFSSPQIGKFADRYGKSRVFSWLAVAACIPLLIASHLGPVAYPLVLANSIALFVLVPGRMIAGMAFLSNLPPPAMRASFMSLVAAVQMFSVGLSALLTGLLIQRNALGQLEHFSWAGYLAVLSGLTAVVLMQRLQKIALESQLPASG